LRFLSTHFSLLAISYFVPDSQITLTAPLFPTHIEMSAEIPRLCAMRDPD